MLCDHAIFAKACVHTQTHHHNQPVAQVHGNTSYTAQDPWIQNCSLQDNILMGLPFDQERYSQVLQACALLPDLELLPASDQTEIGTVSVLIC